ncbi:MAG: hypothetical protein PHF56_23150 [Desulfuromonadaceae bacterium]|nr:hypothetical protein [Desulfuromonadaceae bacterium]
MMKTATQKGFKKSTLSVAVSVGGMLLISAITAAATEAIPTATDTAATSEAILSTTETAAETKPVAAKNANFFGKTSGYIENATFFRDRLGLSKFRNTAQLELEKRIDTSLFINGVFRATYDGVYDLNDSKFGPNSNREGYLGQNWHSRDDATTNNPVLGGKPFISAPVPFVCENDPTLCRNLKGYMDKSKNDARFPEFNDELDFIRELYVDKTISLSNGTKLSARLGKQQVVWGKSDLFRVLDVINPVDYSRQNIYDELQDIRIPQWILKAESRFGKVGFLDELTTSVVWNFDKFRPSVLGQAGQPYKMLDAGSLFSSYMNIDQHPVVGALYPGGPVPIIHDVNIPGWNFANTQIGLRTEGLYNGITFTLNYLHYRQQLPSTHFREHPAVPGSGLPAPDGVYDLEFPEVNLFGGSIDYFFPSIDSSLRMETTYTKGEELIRETDGYQKTDMFRYVIGFDKTQWIPLLNSRRTFLISAQLFGQHILNHRDDMPDYKNDWVGTLLFQGFYDFDRIIPKVLVARDFRSEGMAVAPSVDWFATDNLKITLAGNIKMGGKKKFDWSANDALSGAPMPNDYEPLARFTNGPIGVANKEDEIQLTLRYSF